MKNFRATLLASLASCFIFLTHTASALPISEFGGYVGGFIGATYANNLSTEETPPPIVITELENSFGGNFAFQLGYQIDSFRIEGQMLYNYSDLKNVDTSIIPPPTEGQSDSTKGSTQMFGAFANVMYDFNFLKNNTSDESFIPYIGIGVGYGRVDASGRIVRTTTTTVDDTVMTTSETLTSFDNNVNAPMVQGIIGASLYLDSVFAMTFDYRYIQTGTLSNMSSKFQLHSFNIGIKTLFA